MRIESSPTLSNTFRVGKFLCEMRFDGLSVQTEWAPRMPKGLSKKEWRAYRAGRDALLREVSKHIGSAVLVVEA